jgi:hypothetical protein
MYESHFSVRPDLATLNRIPKLGRVSKIDLDRGQVSRCRSEQIVGRSKSNLHSTLLKHDDKTL